MQKIYSIFIILFLMSCQNRTPTYKNALCIVNISVVDPIKGQLNDQKVIIQDGKITYVGPNDKFNSHDSQIVNGSGKFLIPGLWDAHVHFAYMEELAPSMLDLFLAYGITSVRDTGGKIDWVKKWQIEAQNKQTDAPRVMIAGPLLDGIPNVYDGSAPSRPPLSVGLNSTEEIDAQIDILDSVGVDLLKAYEMLTPEQFEHILTIAKSKELPVTGHVPLSMDVISASNMGLNSMEHLRNLELSCASNADELLAQRIHLLHEGRNDPGGILRSRLHRAQQQNAIENYDTLQAQKVLNALAKNDTWQIPTLVLNTNMSRRPFLQSEWKEQFSYLPDSVEQKWNTSITAFGERDITDFQNTYTDWKMNMVHDIHQTGIPIMAGTDCPIFFLTPGHSLHEELKILEEAGLEPLEVLKTATLNPAKYFKMENELGTISSGKWADLLILNSNPLETIANTMDIDAVIKQGKYHSRKDLDAIFEKLDHPQ